ncbi:MAG: superoxide dismutase family protein [Actinomycetota bacterium]|nr:superoxide dismutase family protein [Actinomycetota bacterium]
MTVYRRVRPGLALVIIGTAMALTPMAYAHQEPKTPAATPAGHERQNPPILVGSGTLAEPSPTAEAVTYNPALAPVGAGILASLTPSGWDQSRTVATLSLAGFQPNRSYAVHVHTNPCGATGEDAGPHYQHRIDPAATPQAPSTNPEYANPRNEIWLDVRTNAAGSGSARTTVPFRITDRTPGSIVVHEAMTTATEPGRAGQAGARIACLTLSPQ